MQCTRLVERPAEELLELVSRKGTALRAGLHHLTLHRLHALSRIGPDQPLLPRQVENSLQGSEVDFLRPRREFGLASLFALVNGVADGQALVDFGSVGG